jgi:hypothetical protein
MPPAVAVDWSGAARGARSHIWLAEAVQPGRLKRLECGREREQLVQHLLDLGPDVVIGLDFAFGFPEWFLTRLRLRSAPELWMHAAANAEAWLSSCAPPFWGRPGHPRPPPADCMPAFRRTELRVPRVAGVGPKSIFQIGGAGAVGTGSLRGMPFLHKLHQAGAAIWPFTAGVGPLVVEIYPRLLTGALRKSRLAERERFLACYPGLGTDHRDLARMSEDAFDAAVSALVMAEHIADLSGLPTEPDDRVRLEGRIWHPGWREDRL